jgi:putative ABC transport system permease protein
VLRNYFAAALGNLSRNWLYAGITVLGLAVSFAAAILIGLYLRDEFSFDRFLPDHGRIYQVENEVIMGGATPLLFSTANTTVAGRLKLDFPQVDEVTRLEAVPGVVKQEDAATEETIAWADPNFFQVLRYPVLAGDPAAALAAPDGLVLTRQMARKYFGQDAPIGRTLMVDANPDVGQQGVPPALAAVLGGLHPMRVMAVLKDMPPDSNLDVQIFAPAQASQSIVRVQDQAASPLSIGMTTYVKLKPGASVGAVRAGLPAFAERHYAAPPGISARASFHLIPLSRLHFSRQGISGAPADVMRPRGDRKVDAGVAAVGALIVIIAAINFITLMTARATRRAVEVGLRKAVGARRRDLVVQFMGEALIYVLIAMVIAIGLAELGLPRLNAFLGRSLRFDYLGDPAIAGVILGAAVLTAVLAGVYPALTLSSFRPAAALKGGANQPAGSAAVRHVLVVVQFAILIGLIVMTGTIYRQTHFALNDALRLDDSQVLRIQAPCRSAFTEEVKRLPGTRALSCASGQALSIGRSTALVTLPDGTSKWLQPAPIDLGFFEMHGLKPVAGRFFSQARGEDMVLDRAVAASATAPTLVLNETAARQLGFANPADAVGKTLQWKWTGLISPTSLPSRVIGIAPDFTLGSVREAIQPTIYLVEPARTGYVLAKLDGRAIPETLRALDTVWKGTGHDRPAAYVFESQAVQDLYRDVITQGVALAVCAGLAILIACLGLFALAAFTTERRTKEIGVRKAMGAGPADVVRLLLWQFTKPVLWANLIAWPLAFWAMDRWLHGFAYRVDLPPWLFLSASAAAVLIAWATVSSHAWMVARGKAAAALRYE